MVDLSAHNPSVLFFPTATYSVKGGDSLFPFVTVSVFLTILYVVSIPSLVQKLFSQPLVLQEKLLYK